MHYPTHRRRYTALFHLYMLINHVDKTILDVRRAEFKSKMSFINIVNKKYVCHKTLTESFFSQIHVSILTVLSYTNDLFYIYPRIIFYCAPTYLHHPIPTGDKKQSYKKKKMSEEPRKDRADKARPR